MKFVAGYEFYNIKCHNFSKRTREIVYSSPDNSRLKEFLIGSNFTKLHSESWGNLFIMLWIFRISHQTKLVNEVVFFLGGGGC